MVEGFQKKVEVSVTDAKLIAKHLGIAVSERAKIEDFAVKAKSQGKSIEQLVADLEIKKGSAAPKQDISSNQEETAISLFNKFSNGRLQELVELAGSGKAGVEQIAELESDLVVAFHKAVNTRTAELISQKLPRQKSADEVMVEVRTMVDSFRNNQEFLQLQAMGQKAPVNHSFKSATSSFALPGTVD
jgi:hypothetical protein